MAIYAAIFVPIMTGTMDPSMKIDEQEKNALLAMCFLGVGEISGSIFNGRLEDKLGPKKMVIINIVEMIIAFVVIISFCAIQNWSFWFAGLFNFFWGVQDAAVNTFIFCVFLNQAP